MKLIQPHDDVLRAIHRNQFASRGSGLPVGYFKLTLGERIERAGDRFMVVVITLAAVFVLVGLGYGWFA